MVLNQPNQNKKHFTNKILKKRYSYGTSNGNLGK